MGKGSGEVGREMLIWLLDKTDRELQEAVGDRRRSKTLRRWGPEYSPELYRQDGHPDASSDKQCHTRESLKKHGLVVPYPVKGHVKSLLLTDKGREYATFLRDHGGCSPDEIERAVRRSSQLDRTRIRMCKAGLRHNDLTEEQRDRLWQQGARLEYQVEAREHNCLEYIRNLPLGLMRSEVKRIAEEGWQEPAPLPPDIEFTDGAPDDHTEQVLN